MSPHEMEIQPFWEVINKYKAVLLDSFGVIKNYNGLIPGVKETIDYIESSDKELLVLTNDASKSPAMLAKNFQNLGLGTLKEDDIISSGMMADYYLTNKVKEGRIVYVGTPNSAYYVEIAKRPFISITDLDLEDVDDISALVFLDDEGFDWKNHLNKAVNLLRNKSIPVIVANSDNTYPTAKNQVNIATGALARMIEKISKKKFIYFGKPDTQMFLLAFEKVWDKRPLKRSEILMVGDTLRTDIMGGNKFGFGTALVLTGNTTEEEMRTYMKSTGIIPDYICPSIAIN